MKEASILGNIVSCPVVDLGEGCGFSSSIHKFLFFERRWTG